MAERFERVPLPNAAQRIWLAALIAGVHPPRRIVLCQPLDSQAQQSIWLKFVAG
ncbi:hypothetical protein [Mycobacterium riyadhense]|uniref:hypothetical protein n=1 Tax=Mycobacterium riyadhense TaxID=486698 RepID=UPI00195D074B|nr:hypothetical protein [Mycobacterium riyadhense]